MSRVPATAAIVLMALLAGVAGVIVSIRIEGGAGPLLDSSAGRWLAERVAASPPLPGVEAANEGEAVGPLSLTSLDGNRQALPSKPGQRLLVNVWASWCAPCRDEMPILAEFAKGKDTSAVAVVGIAEDDSIAVRTYLRQTPANYPVLLDDAQGRAAIRLGNRLGALPFSALIDANGHLLRRQYGPFTSAAALRQWVAAP